MSSGFFKILSEGYAEKDIQALCIGALETLNSGGKFIFAGNGGSLAIAVHVSAELTGRYKKDRESIPSYVLGSNLSSLTGIANDYNYSDTQNTYLLLQKYIYC